MSTYPSRRPVILRTQPQNPQKPSKATEGSHRPIIISIARNAGGVDHHKSHDTSAIRSIQGGVASIQSPLRLFLSPHPPTFLVSAQSAKHHHHRYFDRYIGRHIVPRRVVLYAFVLDRSAPVCSNSAQERINPRTRSLSSNRAGLSV